MWGLLSTIFMVSAAAILVFRPSDDALYAAGLLAFTGGLSLLNRTRAKRDPEWSSDPETRVYPQLLAVRLVAINVMFVSGLAQLDWLMWTGAAILAATLPIGPLVSLRRAKSIWDRLPSALLLLAMLAFTFYVTLDASLFGWIAAGSFARSLAAVLFLLIVEHRNKRRPPAGPADREQRLIPKSKPLPVRMTDPQKDREPTTIGEASRIALT